MAKRKRSYILKQLVNEEQSTKTRYIIKKPTKGLKAHEKIRLRKYDPVLRKHCVFVEKRMPSHAK